MFPKDKAKFIRSLQDKKHRAENGSFTVEGKKSVLELLGSDFNVRAVVCTQEFREENQKVLEGKQFELDICSPSELESISSLKTNDSVLAVAEMRPNTAPGKLQGLTLALDGIGDPGNFGTLLRTADWFGASSVVASEESVDMYNPKVLQASMGSFCRKQAYYTELGGFLKNAGVPVYAASMEGKPVHDFAFKKDCILLLGSESHGISGTLSTFITETIGVPAYGKAESLNVAMAAAVLCDNYRRVTSKS